MQFHIKLSSHIMRMSEDKKEKQKEKFLSLMLEKKVENS